MEDIWLPAPKNVVTELLVIAQEGYRGSTLGEHFGFSLFRVLSGFLLGAIIGIPLGYAMGLSNWFRGWFEPIVEFMRPIPPLALIPLVIIWAGIGETGKIILLFLAALWIMAIAARSGVSAVRISKVHAAYSLGATKAQVMRHVIIPNSLPEIFTGARVAMGVCYSGHYPDWHHRLFHRHFHVLGRKNAYSMERSRLVLRSIQASCLDTHYCCVQLGRIGIPINRLFF